MIAASRVIDLFDETGPSGPPAVGGASEDAIVYYPGGYGSLREVSRMIQEAGPSGLAQAGGSRLRKTRSRSSKTRKNNKKNRRSRNRR
jgi:hypothetical protein